MKLWISICSAKRHGWDTACIHFVEPEWEDDKELRDGGRWASVGEHNPCIYWVRLLLLEIEVPTRPRELIEITISTSGRWEWK